MRVPFFEASGVAYSYPGGRAVLRGASLALERGGVCTILGKNGAGKTTLLNCLGGLLRPAEGSVRIDGRDVHSMTPRERAGLIGYVPQLQGAASDLTVIDYLVLGGAMRIGLLRAPSEADYERAERAMGTFDISGMADRRVCELSGGERQQVEITRSLVQDPEVILLDEPTNHLDYANQVRVLSMIRHLASGRGKTLVVTSHMPDQAVVTGGTVALMGADGTLRSGTVDEMVTEENLRAVYGERVRVVFVPQLGRRVCAMGEVP